MCGLMGRRHVARAVPCVLFLLSTAVLASTPNAILRIDGAEDDLLVKRAEFGSDAEIISGTLQHSPEEDWLLCESFKEDSNQTFEPVDSKKDIIMLVPRGECTFERKAYAAKTYHGASGVIVYDNPSARYKWNETTQRVIFPQAELDYECGNGYGTMEGLLLDPPQYNGTLIDPLMDMTLETANCSLAETRSPCDSQICLVTSHVEGDSSFPVCCAWDTLITMQGDETAGDTSDVVAIFVTIRQSEEILEYVSAEATIEERPDPAFDGSMIVLWLLGTAITANACYYCAKDLRLFRAKLARFQEKRNRLHETGDMANPEIEDIVLSMDDLADFADDDSEKGGIELQDVQATDENALGKPDTQPAKSYGNTWALRSLPPPERKKQKSQPKRQEIQASLGASSGPETTSDDLIPEAAKQGGSFEFTQWHVFGFVVSSSILLFMLFYFNFYNIITVLYGFGCAGSVSYFIFGPTLTYLVPKLGDEWTEELNKSMCCGCNGFDVTSQLLGFVWAIVWLWYGLSHYRPSTNAFFWVSMNIFGACFCTLALSSLRLSNLKIAVILMLSIFIYDVFFVFLTPLFLDGESVMTTVARGGKADSTADDFCYKYPEDRDCTGVDFLPMLLIIPAFNDYNNGSSLLGLGDIVLPGFLIAFGARVDEAARLVGKHSNPELMLPERWCQGYFSPLMLGYAVGLCLAFVAAGLMERGQPALLYIVPALLITISLVGRKELKDLWRGPEVLETAAKLVRRCEKSWGRQRMKRQVEKRKRERALEQPQVYERQLGNKRRQSTTKRIDNTGAMKEDSKAKSSKSPKAEETEALLHGSGEMKKQTPRSVTRSSSGGESRIMRGGPNSGRGRSQRGRGGGRGSGRGSKNRQHPSLSNFTKTRSSSSASGRAAAEDCIPQKRLALDQNVARMKDSPVQKNGWKVKENATNRPNDTDVCFGDENHGGTKDFRKAVKKALKHLDEEGESDALACKAIKRKLKGRLFFRWSPGSGQWQEATKADVMAEFRKALADAQTSNS